MICQHCFRRQQREQYSMIPGRWPGHFLRISLLLVFPDWRRVRMMHRQRGHNPMTHGDLVSGVCSGFCLSPVVSGCNIPVSLSFYSLFSAAVYSVSVLESHAGASTGGRGDAILCSSFRVIIFSISSKNIEPPTFRQLLSFKWNRCHMSLRGQFWCGEAELVYIYATPGAQVSRPWFSKPSSYEATLPHSPS